MRSAAMTSSKAPVKHTPFTAAISGCGMRSKAYHNPPHFMGVGSVGSTLCFISSKYPRNDHILIDLARFWWNCRIDFTIPSNIQVRDPNWRSVSTIPIGIWILEPRSEMIQGKEWQKGTEVSKCVESVFGASKNRKSKNVQNEILDVRF